MVERVKGFAKYKVLYLIGVYLTANLAFANNFGVVGETFTISEPNIKEVIDEKVKDGALKEVFSDFKKKADDLSNLPGANLPKATENRSYFFDPSIKLSKDICSADGKCLGRKGEVFNPLTVKDIKEKYVFINGSRTEELKFAQELLAEENAMVILTNGDITKATKFLKKRLYFDQHGALVSRFLIAATPAVMQQKNKLLEITEYKVND